MMVLCNIYKNMPNKHRKIKHLGPLKKYFICNTKVILVASNGY